uniref:sn-1-specific diacylglycerol lipase n=1 Tax=Chlamydomonas chlamydogama TaxID=225041 RepID=A0A7S2VV56_9CHLO|mmetsp:Transcript_1331/g.2879  ORF Transcript_1331/g.2879 Transcript_1331/m.2879 type:complete len:501 (+) Transcript_1331:132-1634(+)
MIPKHTWLAVSIAVLLAFSAVPTFASNNHRQLVTSGSSLSKIIDELELLYDLYVSIKNITGSNLFNGTALEFATSALHLAAMQAFQTEKLQGGPAPASSKQLLSTLARDANFTLAFTDAFVNSTDPAGVISSVTGLPRQDILAVSQADSLNIQPWYVAFDRNTSRIIVVSRGSTTSQDWLTDFTALTVVLQPGVGVHAGMLNSAKNLINATSATVNGAAQQQPGFSLAFIGHSLGAGVSCIATYLVKNGISGGEVLSSLASSVRGSCLSTPPVLSMNACEAMSSYASTIIFKDDVVPRASVVNLEHLVMLVAAVNNGMAGPALQKLDDVLVQRATQLGMTGMADADAPWNTTAVMMLFQDDMADKMVSDYMNMVTKHHKSLHKGLQSLMSKAADRVKKAGKTLGRRALLQNGWNDPDYYTVPASYPVGRSLVFPLYQPGALFQVLPDIWKTSVVVKQSTYTDRWDQILLKSDMITDHLVPNWLPLLNNYIAQLDKSSTRG